ncbi:response regulator transcription factor [Georgenia sunbinii]|uniref:response regulator transcription factor n=1 Tax=Georgenia sunbinii TaxID=3117728 RepID=UPI002F268822
MPSSSDHPVSPTAPTPPLGSGPIRVLLVDDDPMVLATLQTYIATAEDIDVVATAHDGSVSREAVAHHRPDLVIMDVQMPVMDGIEATRRLREEFPELRVVLLTTFDEDEFLLDALDAGAAGFLLKNTSPQELVTAIRRAHAGNKVVSPGPNDRLIDNYVRRDRVATDPADLGLSGREQEVLELLCRGKSNLAIAEQLYVAETTVKTHVSSIMRKMDVASRLEIVVFAYENRLVR